MSDNPIHRWRAGAVATSAPPGQNTRQGQIPRRAPVAPSHHSNAPIRQEGQSILSKIVALMPRQLTSDSQPEPPVARQLPCYLSKKRATSGGPFFVGL